MEQQDFVFDTNVPRVYLVPGYDNKVYIASDRDDNPDWVDDMTPTERRVYAARLRRLADVLHAP